MGWPRSTIRCYVFDDNSDDLLLFDPVTNTITGNIDITTTNPTQVTFDGSLGALANPDVLIIGSNTDEVFVLDAATGTILSSFTHGGGADDGAAGVGDEIFIGLGINPPTRIEVYDRSGNLLRTLDETTGFDRDIQPFGLAGGSGDEGAHHVTLGTDQDLTGLDFGNQSFLGSISGTKFEDVDGDGMRDAGEGPLQGVTIYLDQNDNGAPDAGEPTTQTDADGRYEFTDLLPGEHIVREVVPVPFRQTTPLTEVPRLFATNVAASPDAILEIDPQTGATLNTFNAPTNFSTGGHGLAFDGTTLYFVDFVSDILFELNPEDGTVLDSTQLPSRAYDGVAALNGLIYAIDTGLDDILVFDPVTNTVLNTLDVNAVNPGINFFGGIGESEGELIAATSTNEVVFLNPANGLVTGSFDHGLPAFDGGLTGFGGEIYLGFNSSSLGIRVFDRDGNPLRTLNVNFPVFGLGGALIIDDAHRVTLGPAEDLTGLDFGNENINVAPTIDSLVLDSAVIDENDSVELTGTFSDPDTPDVHQVIIEWGDGSPNTIIDLTNGETSFVTSHQYLDDGPSPGNGTESDVYDVAVTVVDVFDASVTSGSNSEQLIVNGDFETGDFTGWTVTETASALWMINDGTLDPDGPGLALPPISGDFDAVSTQSGPALAMLTEPIVVPANITSAVLNWSDRIRNHGAGFLDPGQEWRVLVLDEDGGLIQEIFSTDPGDPLQQIGPNERSFDVTGLLQSLAGQTIQLSFEQQAQIFFFNATLDDVSLTVASGVQVTVNNVAPRFASFVDPAPITDKADEGQPVILAFDFTDPGTLDVHTAVIDWGDGNTDIHVLPLGERSLSLDHAYATGGVYTIAVTLSDDDTGSDAFTTTAFVTGVGIVNEELHIVGTSGDDQVVVIQQGNGMLRVLGSFLPEPEGRTYDVSAANAIVAVLCEGDDNMVIAGNVQLPALIDAGSGNDTVQGGGGNDIILGRDGDDELNGGGGLDILIGGRGADRLVGGPGSDLLFGGVFASNTDGGDPIESFRDDATDLQAVQALWLNPGAPIADRADDIENLDAFFSKLFDDQANDELTGMDDDDWFLLFAGDAATDAMTAGNAADLVTNL